MHGFSARGLQKKKIRLKITDPIKGKRGENEERCKKRPLELDFINTRMRGSGIAPSRRVNLKLRGTAETPYVSRSEKEEGEKVRRKLFGRESLGGVARMSSTELDVQLAVKKSPASGGERKNVCSFCNVYQEGGCPRNQNNKAKRGEAVWKGSLPSTGGTR